MDILDWQVAALLQAQPAQSGQLNMLFVDPVDAGQPEATQTLFARFEAWKAYLDRFPGSLLFHPAKEVFESLV